MSQNGKYAEIGVTPNGEDHDKPLDLGLWGFRFSDKLVRFDMHQNNFWSKMENASFVDDLPIEHGHVHPCSMFHGYLARG